MAWTKFKSDFILFAVFFSVTVFKSQTVFAVPLACEKLFLPSKVSAVDQLNRPRRSAISQIFKLSEDRPVFYEYIEPSNKQQPTLLFLPGINRGLTLNDETAKILIKKGYGIIGFATSAHWQSSGQVPANTKPYFLSQAESKEPMTAADFAFEVESLVGLLKKQKLVFNQIIPVTVSYSATIAAHLSKEHFSQIIETTPMGNFAESNVQAHEYMQNLKNSFAWNPFMGGWLDNMTLQSYRKVWQTYVRQIYDQSSSALQQPYENVLEGYVYLVKAAENFDLRNLDYKNTSQRQFIFAEHEESTRLGIQQQAFEMYNQSLAPADSTKQPIVIAKATHLAIAENPKAYVEALEHALKNFAKLKIVK
ncbi:MAG: hypothetical protein ACOYOK_06125 [Pseudobdellovibrionaceae bacterium]